MKTGNKKQIKIIAITSETESSESDDPDFPSDPIIREKVGGCGVHTTEEKQTFSQLLCGSCGRGGEVRGLGFGEKKAHQNSFLV